MSTVIWAKLIFFANATFHFVGMGNQKNLENNSFQISRVLKKQEFLIKKWLNTYFLFLNRLEDLNISTWTFCIKIPLFKGTKNILFWGEKYQIHRKSFQFLWIFDLGWCLSAPLFLMIASIPHWVYIETYLCRYVHCLPFLLTHGIVTFFRQKLT